MLHGFPSIDPITRGFLGLESSSLGWLLGSGDEQMKESDSWTYGEEDSRPRKPLVMGSMDGNPCSI